jgi:hypothetical protein
MFCHVIYTLRFTLSPGDIVAIIAKIVIYSGVSQYVIAKTKMCDVLVNFDVTSPGKCICFGLEKPAVRCLKVMYIREVDDVIVV